MGESFEWNTSRFCSGSDELPDELKYSICKMFADDFMIYSRLNQENVNKLQVNLINLERWPKKWKLPFNPSKFKVMHFGKKNPKNYFVLYDRVLDTVTQEKNLGVIVDEQLKFHEHTAVASKKENQILGLIKISYSSRDPYTIKTLYKTMVRPHLEYGNAMWGPVYLGDIHKVEKIQRRATKMIYSIKNLPNNLPKNLFNKELACYEQRFHTLTLSCLRNFQK